MGILKWLNPLILALPAAMIGLMLGWRPALIFGLSALALIPLAGMIGHYADQLSEYLGDVAGGLLNATFGNAPEIIIGVLLLLDVFYGGDATGIVQALIIGSIISNALLVLGLSIFLGASRNGRLTFSAVNAGGYASMLALAVAALALPALAVFLGNADVRVSKLEDQVHLSVVVAIVMLFSYFAYLAATIFHVGERDRAGGAAPAVAVEAGSAGLGVPVLGEHPSVPETEVERLVDAQEHDAAGERAELRAKRKGQRRRIGGTLVMLFVATGLTVVASIVLVSVMKTVIDRTVLTPFFVGLIVLPFITNAVEAFGSIRAAWNGRMEETMAIAAGSSVQVALLVGPLLALFSVVFGLAFPMTMVFSKIELIIVTLVTFVYALISLDGETTWLEGLQLVAFYAMVAATAFFLE